jgi:hypothetical protein
MLGDSVEKRKNIVWRDYDRSMFSIWSKSKKATYAWWESIALSHVKLHPLHYICRGLEFEPRLSDLSIS